MTMKPARTRNRRIAMFAAYLTRGALAAWAADFYVWRDNPNPEHPYTNWSTAATAIQDAVDEAGAGDTVWVTNGVYDTGGRPYATYALTNRVYLSGNITLASMNGPEVTIIRGSADPVGANGFGPAAARGLFGVGGRVIGFTLTNGHTMATGNATYDQDGGGALLRDGTVVSNCVIAGNTCWDSGGGVYTLYHGTLINCEIMGNTAVGSGGGVSSYDTSTEEPGAIWRNCTISGNTALSGGGALFSGANGLLESCTLANNTATASGGGGVVLKGQMLNCTVEGNTCGTQGGSGGGGAYVTVASALTSNCVFRNNSNPGGTGGGIYLLNGLAVDCVISNNSAKYGGGARVSGGLLSRSLLAGNQSTRGAIYQLGGVTADCLVSNNVADYGGGAYPGGGVIDRCLFVTNQAVYGGGAAVFEGSDKGVIQNSLLIRNHSSYGGAIRLISQAPGVLTNCTLAGNLASTLGGGIYAQSTNASLHNTILWGNIRMSNNTTNNLALASGASPPRFTYSCCHPLQPGEGNIDAEPRFIDPTAGDFRLKLPSPCANRGLFADWMTNACDVAGNPRAMGSGVDLGAYEAWPLPTGTLFICR